MPRKKPVLPDLSGYTELRIWAESYEDAQKARISCTNRIERGEIEAESFRPQLESLERAEHEFELGMRRCYRRVAPEEIREWEKDSVGIGEHAVARLLGLLGHPLYAIPHRWMEVPPKDHDCIPQRCGDKRHLVVEKPFERTLGQLCGYCGYGDADRKRRKGMSAEEAAALGNPRLKSLLYVMAVASIRTQDRTGRWKYRAVYDAARERYADREDWSDGRRHSAAIRKVIKAILRDVYNAVHIDN